MLNLQFVDDYEPTKLDSYQTMMDYQGQDVDVQITDTAGLFYNLHFTGTLLV